MKRLSALLLLAFAAGVAGSAGPPVAAAKEPAVDRATAVLAVVGGSAPRLVWLDPRTLKPLKLGAVPLGGSAYGAVFSPTGGRVAIGGSGALGTRIVDVFRMKLVGRIAGRSGDWGLAPVVWPSERRLLVLESNVRTHAQALLVVDPVARRVLRRTPLEGVSLWRIARSQVVFLGAPEENVGAARLLVADPNGDTRSVVLDRIPAGGRTEGTEEDPTYRIASPGLAVDPAAHRAYVVGQAPLVAEIDLDSLTVTYRELSRPASLLGRFLNWLEPSARAKAVTGWHRQAVWQGDGLLAVAGSDYDRLRRAPSGLELVDLRTATVRRLEDSASFVATAGGMLLAGGEWTDGNGNEWSGMGLAAYAADGRTLWRVLGGEPVGWLQTAGGYAYVAGPEAYPPTVRVIDLATGSVRVVRGELPYFVTP